MQGGTLGKDIDSEVGLVDFLIVFGLLFRSEGFSFPLKSTLIK